MITRTPFARAAASAVLAGALLVGTAGCTFLTPQATLNYYDPSDGVGTTVGTIRVLNAVGIIGPDAHSISLIIQLTNQGSKRANVDLQFISGSEKTTVTKSVAAGETLSFGTTEDAEQIVILNPDVPAGALLPVYVQYGENPGSQLLVPVLEPTGPYEDLAPPAILRK